MAYTILQLAADARLRLAELKTRAGASPRYVPRLWTNPISRTQWTLDYCGWEGMWAMVETGGRWSAPFARRPGTWHLYAPHVRYRERQDRPDLHDEDMWLIFTLARPQDVFRKGLFASIHDPEAVIPPRLRAMYALQQKGEPGGALAAHGLFLSMLGEIAAAARRGGDGDPARPWRVQQPGARADDGGGRLLERVDALASARLDDPPGVEELAEALSVSVSTLAHRFKAETGMTVVERIRWLRIRAARALLGRRGASVKSAAAELGFSSPFYFSKVFKEIAGILPQAYLRKQARR